MFEKDSLPKTTTNKITKAQHFEHISNRQVFPYSVVIPLPKNRRIELARNERLGARVAILSSRETWKMGRYSIKGLQNPLRNQQGAYILITGITVVALFGFAALGIEVGRWYAIQGEMSKAIAGAAFAGAKNVNNPNITDIEGFVQQVA